MRLVLVRLDERPRLDFWVARGVISGFCSELHGGGGQCLCSKNK
jgi:hypothetical protein